MNNEQIAMELYNSGFLRKYIQKRAIGSQYIDDMVQDLFIMLVDYPLLINIYEKGGISRCRALAAGIIQRSLSEKGLWYRKYKRELSYTDNEIPDTSYEQKINI